MRRVLIASVSMALLATAACVTEATQSRADLPDPVAPSAAAAEVIAIREQSNVCVSVQVDQAIWPVQLAEGAHWNFGGGLAARMRQIYEQRGGSIFLPGPGYVPRFVAEYNGLNPACRDPEDIHVSVHYSARPDGTPFVLDYRIEQQGAASKSGSFSRDILEEYRTGRITRLNIEEPFQKAIWEDIRARAEFLLQQITG